MGFTLDSDQLNTVDTLRKYPECIENYKRFSSLMSDCLSHNIVLKRVMCSAYEEGILESIRDTDNPQNSFAYCFKRLIDKCGMTDEYAKWVLITISSYFGYEEELAATGILSVDNIYFHLTDNTLETANARINYREKENGIEITNIILIDVSETINIAVIPEYINNKPVTSVMYGALNNLRKNKIVGIILPCFLTSLGESGKKLYSGYEGRERKLSFYRAFIKYSDITIISETFNVKGVVNDTIGFFDNRKINLLQERELFYLNDKFTENEYWQYPENDLWIDNGILVRYTGTSRDLNLNVSDVSSYAISGLEIESIKFTSMLQSIASNGINECSKLKRIIFPERRVDLDDNSIYNCENLRDIKWPFIDPATSKNFIHNCPVVGDSLIIDKTLYYMKTDEEVIVIDKESGIDRIGKYAFAECNYAKVIYIGGSVSKIYDDFSKFEAVILDNNEVEWLLPKKADKEMYIYLSEDSFVFRNISGQEMRTGIYLKDMAKLQDAFVKEKPQGLSLKGDFKTSINKDILLSMLDDDCCDDIKPDTERYLWEKEAYERR